MQAGQTISAPGSPSMLTEHSGQSTRIGRIVPHRGSTHGARSPPQRDAAHR